MPRTVRRRRYYDTQTSKQDEAPAQSSLLWALGAGGAAIVTAYAVARFGFGIDVLQSLLGSAPRPIEDDTTDPVGDSRADTGESDPSLRAPSDHAEDPVPDHESQREYHHAPGLSETELRVVFIDGGGRGASVMHVIAGLHSDVDDIQAAAAKAALRHASHKALRMEMTRLGGFEALLLRLAGISARSGPSGHSQAEAPLLLQCIRNYCSDAPASDLILDLQRQSQSYRSVGPLDVLQDPLRVAAEQQGDAPALGEHDPLLPSLHCLGNLALRKNPATKLLQRGAFAYACSVATRAGASEELRRRALALACNVAVTLTAPANTGGERSVVAQAALATLCAELGEGAAPLATWLTTATGPAAEPGAAQPALRVLLAASQAVPGRRALLRNERSARGSIVPWLARARVLTEARSRAERAWRRADTSSSPRGRAAAAAPGVSLAVSVSDLERASREAGSEASGGSGSDGGAGGAGAGAGAGAKGSGSSGSDGMASVEDLRASGFMLIGGDGAHLEGRGGTRGGSGVSTPPRGGGARSSAASTAAGDPTDSVLTAGGDGEAHSSQLHVLPDEGLGDEERQCVVLAAQLARELSRAEPAVLMRVLDAAARRRVQGGAALPQLGRPVEHS